LLNRLLYDVGLPEGAVAEFETDICEEALFSEGLTFLCVVRKAMASVG